jgi:hypothetical protein
MRITKADSLMGAQVSNRRLYASLLLLLFSLMCLAGRGRSQEAAISKQSHTSLANALDRAAQGRTELHIFYVHGMGINPPSKSQDQQDFETSQEFRTSLCHLVRCANKIGEQYERREYAHAGPFAPDSNPPNLYYLGEKIWRTIDQAGNPTNDDWHAAAPFVNHYKLLRNDGSAIHLHEINWWPLILSAKCRQIVAKEAALIGRDEQHIKICSAPTVPDSGVRFKSYQWITGDEIHPPAPSGPRAAPFNRSQKAGVLDWGFSDAVLALGPIRDSLITGIREIVRDIYVEAAKAAVDQKREPEFIVVSHSLGSYLMFSALDLPSDSPEAKIPEWKQNLDDLLRKTSNAYFMANQIRLLELANLDKASKDNLIAHHLKAWGDFRAEAHQTARIDAFSDPSDWLTWQVPENDKVTVINHSVKNAIHWFWYFENPAAAHLNYDKNKQVLRVMLQKD